MPVAVQAPPFGCRPQEPATQVAGAVQSVFTLQMLLHTVAAQRPGAQLIVAAATQVPLPLQVDGGARVEAVGQLAARHWLPEAQRAH